MAILVSMVTSPKGRVLFVGSDADPTARGLGELGFEVQSTTKVPTTHALANGEPYDVVLLDIIMPAMDGLSLVSRLRERIPGVPVVVLTTEYTNELAARGAEVGVSHYLEKPTDLISLERLLRASVFERHRLLSTLRAVVHPATLPRAVAATDAKNEFGSILESAVHDGAVIITKHDTPKAVLISVERLEMALAKQEPDLTALTREFDEVVAHMRTPKARAAARGLFKLTPAELGKAALAGAKRGNG